MKYQVIPFMGKLKGSQGPSEVASQIQIQLNAQADRGWTYVETSSVNIEVQPGCLAGLLGARTEYMRLDMLVFVRTIEGEARVLSAPPTVESPRVDEGVLVSSNLQAGRALAKKLQALGFLPSEIVSQLVDRGFSEIDAKMILQSSAK